MLLLSIVFAVDNVSEELARRKANEDTSPATTTDQPKPKPQRNMTFDAILIISGCYVVNCFCIVIPQFDVKNSSHSYTCNLEEDSVSLGNPFNGGNGLAFFWGLLLFTSVKVGLLYTAMLCISLWFTLYRPLSKVDLKKYLHTAVLCIVLIFDIIVIAGVCPIIPIFLFFVVVVFRFVFCFV